MQQHPIRQAVILAGGRGSRLGPLTECTPKPVLPVAGYPFLYHLLRHLAAQGVTDVVVAVGHLGRRVQELLGPNLFGIRLYYSNETEPLGTGGALVPARRLLPHPREPFFVCNGDTLFDVPLQQAAGIAEQTHASAVLFVRPVADTARFGSVHLDREGRVVAFSEKASSGGGCINAGVYVFTPEGADALPEGNRSLERQILPELAAQGRLAACPAKGLFLDMGIPETYARAQLLLASLQQPSGPPVVFLDRDGTLIAEKHYLHRIEDVEVLPGVLSGLRDLCSFGCRLFMITNQSGIGRGFYTLDAAQRVNGYLLELFAKHSIRFDEVFMCPHTPESGCFCRKPNPGMVFQALGKHGFNIRDAVVVGDKACDMQLGLELGMTSILVRTGYGKDEEHNAALQYDAAVRDVREAANCILSTAQRRPA